MILYKLIEAAKLYSFNRWSLRNYVVSNPEFFEIHDRGSRLKRSIRISDEGMKELLRFIAEGGNRGMSKAVLEAKELARMKPLSKPIPVVSTVHPSKVRRETVGSYCKRCRDVLPPHRLSCSCMALNITFKAIEKFKELNWNPVFIELDVSMESANRR